MDRTELIRLMVLDSICDGYEDVDERILPTVAKYMSKLGFEVERSDVVHTLASLVGDGLAKAYHLSPTKPVVELEGMPPLDDNEEGDSSTYFYITPKGLDVTPSISPAPH